MHFIKTGFWEKSEKGFKGWLNLESLQPSVLISAFTSVLTFNKDKDIYYDATGEDVTFSLSASNNVNGAGIYLRLNKPASVTFPANFEEDNNSEPLDDTKLNMYVLIYFSNWDGQGTERVIYSNKLFDAL